MTGSKTRKRIIRVKESALVAGTDMVLFSVFNPLSLSLFARMLLVSVCTRATSRSWFPLWSWRATRRCGSRLSASTKCASPSARIRSWRCAPRAWVHRQKHCGSVCLLQVLIVVTVEATNCSILFHKQVTLFPYGSVATVP